MKFRVFPIIIAMFKQVIAFFRKLVDFQEVRNILKLIIRPKHIECYFCSKLMERYYVILSNFFCKTLHL